MATSLAARHRRIDCGTSCLETLPRQTLDLADRPPRPALEAGHTEAWDGSKPLYHGGINGSPTPHAMDLESSDWQDVTGDQEAWQADVAALRDVSEKMKARVHTADEASLQQPFPGEEMPAVLRLVRMATHDVYHSGQIRYLRALRGL